MRSLHVLLWQELHPTVHGGAESWVRDTAAGLRLLGHQVAWLQSDQIRETVSKLRPDVVILGTLHCFVGLRHVAWLAEQRIPALWMLHDYWPFCGPRMLLQAHNQSDQPCEAVGGHCLNSCGAQVDALALVNRFHVLTGCEGAAAIMCRHGVHVGMVIEEGVDADLFRPGAEPRETGRVVYASAAGDDRWKGIHVLRQAVEGTGVEVRFLTGLARPALAEELRRAAVYVFPSVYQETWGLALTEAMASGCAVVASDVAGARAQLHDQPVIGILTPPGEPYALRQQIEHLLAEPKLGARMGEAARAHVEQDHSLASIGKRWEAVCQEVAGCAV